ncbi:MAG: DUF2634 domain-containing protein [Firmicutes bacterium]|nr:DUF2634 domain-containing protein [Bacillota bacterium]
MVPVEYNVLQNAAELKAYPTRTYALDMENARIIGYVDGTAAMRQAVYKILMTERFLHIIYSTNYGTQLDEIMDRLYVYAVVEQRITEALMQDDRIIGVYDFKFKRNKNSLSVSFTVDTTQGRLTAERSVF